MSASSMWTGLKPGHVSLVARFWSKFALRTGGGLVFLLVLLITGLSVAGAFIAPVEQIVANPEVQRVSRETGERIDADRLVDEVARNEGVRDAVKWITGGNEEQTTYLLASKPALLSAIVLLLLMLYPFLVCFGGFNQTSGDIQNRGMRFLLLRTERANIFFGRFLGAATFTLVYAGLMLLLIVIYVAAKLRIYGFGELALWALQGWIALVFLALPYLAICSWISAAIDSPFGSLVLVLLFTTIPLAFLMAASAILKADYGDLSRILPWGWKYDLLHVDLGKRLLAMVAMLGFTGLFLLLGLRTFHKRDL